MKITNYLSLTVCCKLCALALFLSISTAFANNFTEVKPIKPKGTQKTKALKETHEVAANLSNATVACEPRNCVPVLITKSKSVVK
ncbi:hypothetical protein GCM10027442_40900 [Emticicia fontis]